MAEAKEHISRKEKVHQDVLNQMQVSHVYNSVLRKQLEELQEEMVRISNYRSTWK